MDLMAIDTMEFGPFRLTGCNALINRVVAGTNARNELRDLGLVVEPDSRA